MPDTLAAHGHFTDFIAGRRDTAAAERRSGIALVGGRPLSLAERDALRELRNRFLIAAREIDECVSPGVTVERALESLGKVEADTGGLAISVATRLGRA